METTDLDILNQISLTNQLKRRQQIMDNLKKRFRKEYLSQLILKRSVKENRQINAGNVVLIGDDNYKRIDWPLIRVEELIKGRDKTNRVAVLKTKDGKLKRPIQRIYPLKNH